MSTQHPLTPPIDKQAWEASGRQIHARFSTGDGRPDIISFVASFATEPLAEAVADSHNFMLGNATRPRGHTDAACEALAPSDRTILVNKPQNMGKSEHQVRLTREWLEETRRPVVLAGADINAGGITMHVSAPSLGDGMALVGETDRRARGRAAILAKLVEWRRNDRLEHLGFYVDGFEDRGAAGAGERFSVQGVIDLGELIEAFAMAAAGHNFGERLDIAEAECAALAEANARYRILLDR